MKRLILAPDSWPQAATAGKSRQELETVTLYSQSKLERNGGLLVLTLNFLLTQFRACRLRMVLLQFDGSSHSN